MSPKHAKLLLTFWGCVLVALYAKATVEGFRQGWDVWRFVAAYLGLVFTSIEAVATVLVFSLVVISIYERASEWQRQKR